MLFIQAAKSKPGQGLDCVSPAGLLEKVAPGRKDLVSDSPRRCTECSGVTDNLALRLAIFCAVLSRGESSCQHPAMNQK